MRLELDRGLTEEAFALAEDIASPVVEFARAHTTVAIERTVARLFGVDGVDELGVPLPNVLVDALGPRLGEGLALPLDHAEARHPQPRIDSQDPHRIERDAVADGSRVINERDLDHVEEHDDHQP